ncbi:MAG: hypothetical protein PHO53_06210 [Actinomycetota bacterium]|nr:hypothetical protein [Actinomycetota bacterium]
MDYEKNINMLKRMRDARIKKLGEVGPFIAGTVVEFGRVCGRENCRKCAKGERHKTQQLTYKDDQQKTVCVYIPVDKIEEVKEWTKEYKKLKRLIAEIGDLQEQILKRHVTEKRLKRGRP